MQSEVVSIECLEIKSEIDDVESDQKVDHVSNIFDTGFGQGPLFSEQKCFVLYTARDHEDKKKDKETPWNICQRTLK